MASRTSMLLMRAPFLRNGRVRCPGLGVHPWFERTPQIEDEEAHQNVGRSAVISLMINGPAPEVARDRAKRHPRLHPLATPAPQLRRIGFLAVGAQPLRAFSPARFWTGRHVARDLQPDRTTGGVALSAGLPAGRRGRIFAQGPAISPAHPLQIGLRSGAQPSVDLRHHRGPAGALALVHGAFFLQSGRAPAEHVFFAGFAIGVGD